MYPNSLRFEPMIRVNSYNAYAYIIEPKDRGVLSVNPWIRETFIETSLNSYLEACRQFHSTYCRSLSFRILNWIMK